MELVDRFTFLSYLVIGWTVLLQLQVHYNFTYLLKDLGKLLRFWKPINLKH